MGQIKRRPINVSSRAVYEAAVVDLAHPGGRFVIGNRSLRPPFD
jgi:hypothetical protein